MKSQQSAKRRKPWARIGIDIGGTFTDLVAHDESGKIWRVKVPTTPDEPALGALESVRKFLHEGMVSPSRVTFVMHATTLASNALLQGGLHRTALVTTEGFRDVLEIGRQNRPELYNLQVERLPPLIPRQYRFEVAERVTFDGRVLHPLDGSDVQRTVRSLRRAGVESVAICFLHSYANPRNERHIVRVIRDALPQAHVSVSSELLPEFREYERTSTTVVNAVLQPVMSKYLESLSRGLTELGIRAPLILMQSNGGTILSERAVREPARIIESGPVAGAVASRHYARRAGKSIISLDVGGTTSKAGVWSGDNFDVTTDYEVGGRIHGTRRLEGSGYPVKFPFVDLVEVGTGGGSYAQVDEAGVLHVGPESAGASPGPACYGKGGTRPTVTDANLVLGRLNPEYLLGGDLKLDSARAESSLNDIVARQMRTHVVDAAAGVLRVAIANMAGALRAATVERGYDPRQMILVAFGGAGPMHACEIALQMGIPKVIVPPGPGLLSSLGLLLSEPLHDFVRTILTSVDQAKPQVIEASFRAMQKKGRALFQSEKVPEGATVFERFLDLRYQGQAYELSVPVVETQFDEQVLRMAARDFHRMHERKYGYSDTNIPVELVNLRVYCKGKLSPWAPTSQPSTLTRPSPVTYRKVFLNERFVDKCPIYEGGGVVAGTRGRGPCVIEQYDSTIVIPSGIRFTVEENGSYTMLLAS